MKNENDANSSKEKHSNSKIAVLKKKLSPTSTSTSTSTDEIDKKLKKGKKLKKTTSANLDPLKPSKTSTFVRKFGKYMTSTPSPDIRRASLSKSFTTESDTSASDRVSSSDCSSSTLLLAKRRDSDGTPAEEVEGVVSSNSSEKQAQIQQKQPVSVTPYAISTWRSNNTQQPDNNNKINVDELVENEFMDNNKIITVANTDSNNEHDNNDKHTIIVPDQSAIEDIQDTSSDYNYLGQEREHEESASDNMPAFGNLVMDMSKDRPDITSNISQSGLERKEHLYKILVIGELGTGKTSIIKRYVHQFFSQHYRATIGVDFALKVLNWDANTIIRLQLWDIAGQERFGNMTRVYYKDAVGAFIVFDVTRVATFDAVDKWKQDLDSKVQLPDGSSIPCVLLGNKCDQQKEGIVNTPSRMDEYCKEKGFSGWFETSAKENVNIEEAARFLVNKILLNDKLLHSSDMNKDNDRIAIDEKGNANGHNKSMSKTCSC